MCFMYLQKVCTYMIGTNLKLTSNFLSGRAMTQAVSRRLFTAEARVRSRVTQFGICGGQSGTGTGFSRVLRFSSVNFIQLSNSDPGGRAV
jgi:hypothetical protein